MGHTQRYHASHITHASHTTRVEHVVWHEILTFTTAAPDHRTTMAPPHCHTLAETLAMPPFRELVEGAPTLLPAGGTTTAHVFISGSGASALAKHADAGNVRVLVNFHQHFKILLYGKQHRP